MAGLAPSTCPTCVDYSSSSVSFILVVVVNDSWMRHGA